ncbi:hypothetical protein VTN49DRAFT_7818 [Thermomyces lanuginosus]|uniref:uncharacterized protein n=1 Tax=Thermomyces lanuginosus TaxID=5541 RepID=UPI003742230D
MYPSMERMSSGGCDGILPQRGDPVGTPGQMTVRHQELDPGESTVYRPHGDLRFAALQLSETMLLRLMATEGIREEKGRAGKIMCRGKLAGGISTLWARLRIGSD